MKIKSYLPATKILQDHIAYFYFLETDDPDFTIDFKVFPQLLIPVMIHRHATLKRSGSKTIVRGGVGSSYLTVCNGLLAAPLNASIKGVMDRVTIVFKPLGLNHFIDKPHKLELEPDIQIFPYWLDDRYEQFLETFFNAKRHTKKLQLLESFLVSRYTKFSEFSILNTAIDMLCDFQRTVRISEVAASIGMNERQFNRLFKSFLSVSPVQFRKIARFRYSVSALDQQKQGKLTQVAHDSQFFDQAHFIRDYKKLTGKVPGRFLRSISATVDGRVLMEVLKEQ